MVDFHCHILPEIDDGSKSMAMSINMARVAQSLGIKDIITTPHFNDSTAKNYFDQINIKHEALQNALIDENINITIHVAAEVAFQSDMDLIVNTKEIRWKNKFILLELPEHEIPYKMNEKFYDLRRLGLMPILAHPERNVMIQENPKLLKTLMEMGVYLQCDAGSLIGQFGTGAQKTAAYLSANQLYSFIGSDAHDDKSRSYEVLKGLNDFLENSKLLSLDAINERYFPEKEDGNFFHKLKERIFQFLT